MSELTTPISQSGHWQPQHAYTHHVSSPHVDSPPPMEAPHLDSARWSPHPSHPQHQAVSMAVQDPSIHAMDSTSMSYPSPYGMESNTRAMSYPLESTPLVTSQPLPMSGYATPTSHHSPHPSDYQRHVSVPMHHQGTPGQGPPQQPTSAPFSSYPVVPQSGYATPVSHAEPMPLMQHGPPLLNEQGSHLMYHLQPNMKVEH